MKSGTGVSNPNGQPGNRSRTGMPKPDRSGRPNSIGKPVVSLTIRVSEPDKLHWKAMASSRDQSIGEFIREVMTIASHEYSDHYGYDARGTTSTQDASGRTRR